MLTRRSVNDTNMKLVLTLFLVVSLLLCTAAGFLPGAPVALAQTAIDGFSTDRAVAQRSLEERFRAVPAPNAAREHLRILTRDPHIAGTKEDYATAVYVRDQLRSYGITAELKEYEVWLNYPNSPASSS